MFSPLLVALLVEGGGILPPSPNRVAGLLVTLAGGGKNGRFDLGILQGGMTFHVVGGVGQETVDRFRRGGRVARGRKQLVSFTPIKIGGRCGDTACIIPDVYPLDAVGHEIGREPVGVGPQRGVERLAVKLAIISADLADVVGLDVLLDLCPCLQERNGFPCPPLAAHAFEILGQLASVIRGAHELDVGEGVNDGKAARSDHVRGLSIYNGIAEIVDS